MKYLYLLVFLPVLVFSANWNLSVFLNGDNSLSSYGDKDLSEMMKVGSSNKLSITVLQDTDADNAILKYIKKGSYDVLKEYGSYDMGDYKNLEDFMKYSETSYPADKRLLILWNHGAGWRLAPMADRGVSYDDHSGNHITTAQLEEIANNSSHYAVVSFDACLMAMIEIQYGIRNMADYIVASEETEPGDGYAYDLFLPYLASNSSAEEVAKGMVVAYGKYYGNQSVTLSAIKTDFSEVIPAFNTFVKELLVILPTKKAKISAAINNTASYAYSDYKDLIGFVMQVKPLLNDQEAASDLIKALNKIIVANYAAGSLKNNSFGSSIWIPTKYVYNNYKSEYIKLAFAKDTNWNEFLAAYLK